MLKEFRAFLMKGNVIDLAVAVIIAAAFGTIVSSLIDDIITPLILAPALKAARVDNIANLTMGTVKYGLFLSAIIKFLVIAFVLFLVVKILHRQKKNEVVPPPGPTQEELLIEIRDLLKK
ncbi:MAG TPA: large conductance mechanosensitive channel protein MscL [Saprospiraceae bacterium]|nr:large conductance mechanosensitive channel protein MscL [Saprospiraceae bacterium]